MTVLPNVEDFRLVLLLQNKIPLFELFFVELLSNIEIELFK